MLRSICRERRAACGGFTLIEALVAMALLLAFVSVLGPHLFYARRIADQIDGRIAAQALLRTILDRPIDRATLANGPSDGETGGLRWTVSAEPMFIDAMVQRREAAVPAASGRSDRSKEQQAAERPSWVAFHLVATVSWAPGLMVSADTMRLGLAGADQ